MPFRRISIPAIVLFFVGVIVWTFVFGPARRTFVMPNKTVTVQTAGELDSLWHTSRVHGRTAVLFARHLNNSFSVKEFPEMDYLDTAMTHGIVRAAYYVVPDRAWGQAIAENIENPSIIVQPRITDTGYMLLHEGGRIHVVPFSKYIPEQDQEKALVVIEPGIWSEQERTRIDGFIRSGQLSSDLVVIVNGTKQALSAEPSGPAL